MKRMMAVVGLMFGLLVYGWAGVMPAHALQSFSMSPMSDRLILNPGESYQGYFEVTNTSEDEDMYYHAVVEPYFVDDNNEPIFTNNSDMNRIVEWIGLENADGIIKVGEKARIGFTIDVPDAAAGGGQYAVISVSNKMVDGDNNEDGAAIGEVFALGHTILAEIVGDSVINGEVMEMSIPSVRLDNKIMGKSVIKNSGNVHSEATNRLKVASVFSPDNILYDSGENGIGETDKNLVLPGQIATSEISWDNTPMMGIFNVVYTVEYQGNTNEASGIVVVFPWWLLITMLIVVVVFIIRIMVLMKLSRAANQMKK